MFASNVIQNDLPKKEEWSEENFGIYPQTVM
jgi:hypothetical protein